MAVLADLSILSPTETETQRLAFRMTACQKNGSWAFEGVSELTHVQLQGQPVTGTACLVRCRLGRAVNDPGSFELPKSAL